MSDETTPPSAATPPARRRGGRPTKYTPETVEAILTVLRTSGTRRSAYEMAGVNHETFALWIRRYPEFSQRVREAENRAERIHVLTVHSAAMGERSKDGKGWIRQPDWRASMAWLERRRAEDWGRRDRFEHTGDGGGPIQVQGEVVVFQIPDNGRGDATAIPVRALRSVNGTNGRGKNGNGNGRGP